MSENQDRLLFAQLLSEHQARLFGYIHSLVRNLSDTDDLFQQVAMILWRKFAAYDRERSFFSWACGIARLEAANFIRSRQKQKLYLSDDLTLMLIEAQAELKNDEAESRRSALSECLKKLRQCDRELLQECLVDDIAVPAVAARAGRSPQSIYNSLRRIQRALFECVSRALERERRPECL